MSDFQLLSRKSPSLCNPVDCSTPGFPVLHYLLEFSRTHVHWVGDAIQPSHSLSSPSPPAFNLSQHHCLFKWVGSSHQGSKALELQLQHQPFQWILMVDVFNHYLCIIPEHFHHPKETLHPLTVILCSLLSPDPGKNFTMDLLILDIRYKLHHTCDHLCLPSHT